MSENLCAFCRAGITKPLTADDERARPVMAPPAGFFRRICASASYRCGTGFVTIHALTMENFGQPDNELRGVNITHTVFRGDERLGDTHFRYEPMDVLDKTDVKLVSDGFNSKGVQWYHFEPPATVNGPKCIYLISKDD